MSNEDKVFHQIERDRHKPSDPVARDPLVKRANQLQTAAPDTKAALAAAWPGIINVLHSADGLGSGQPAEQQNPYQQHAAHTPAVPAPSEIYPQAAEFPVTAPRPGAAAFLSPAAETAHEQDAYLAAMESDVTESAAIASPPPTVPGVLDEADALRNVYDIFAANGRPYFQERQRVDQPGLQTQAQQHGQINGQFQGQGPQNVAA